jgi:hypothetical protein
LSTIHQPEVRLVDQGGGLQGLPGLPLGHSLRRELAQFVVHRRQQLLAGVGVAPVKGVKDASHLVH